MKIKMLKILLIFLLVRNGESLSPMSALYREVFTYHNETAGKAEYALQVVDKIYYAFRQWYFTIIFCEFTYFENRILKYTENKESGYPVLLINSCPSTDKTKVKPKLDKHGKTAYVVTSEELSLDLNERVIEALLRTGVFKPRNTVIFVISLPVEVDSYYYYDMLRHFELLTSRNIANSVLIVYSDKLRVYAYNKFFNAVNEVTDVENLGKLLTENYNDLYGHKIRLSVYDKISNPDDNTVASCNTSLITIVMTALNATCVPLAPRDGNTVGDLLDNGTATGVTKDLLDGYTDFELNSRILKTSYYGYIDTTYPLYQDELCFFTRRISEPQSSFTTAIKLISLRMLFLFIFNVLFFIALGVFIRHFEAEALGFRQKRFSSVMTDIIKCFLRQTLDITFLGPAFRLMALVVMIYSLIINCVIDSILISAITYPRYKSDISTMSELFNSNLTMAIHNRDFQLFINTMAEEHFKIIQNRIEVVNDKKIKEIIKKRQYNYAVLLRKSDALAVIRNVANMDYGRQLFQMVAECPLPCSIVYGMKYGSPYYPKVNDILVHLYQAGILDYWHKVEDSMSSSSLGKILNANDNKEGKPLTISNLTEVFYVWLVGLFISALAFAYEMFWSAFLKRLWII